MKQIRSLAGRMPRTLRFAMDDIGHLANVLVKTGISCDHKTALRILNKGVNDG